MRSWQYSGVPGRTTLDSIAYAQLHKLLCILSSDSEAATNKLLICTSFVSWRPMITLALCTGLYKTWTMERMGTSKWFSIQTLPRTKLNYTKCPMSMLLFALALNQLLFILDRHLAGIRCSNRTQGVHVVA